jgi:hypothetical protein
MKRTSVPLPSPASRQRSIGNSISTRAPVGKSIAPLVNWPALVLQQLLHPAHRIALLVEKAVDSPRERDVVGAIIAAVAGPLERPQLRKLRLPVTQDMLRDPKLGAELADRSESVRGFFAGRHADS